MAAPQTEIESQVIELLGKSFGRPCDDIPAKEVARAWEEFRKTLWPLRTSCIGEQENEAIAKAHEKPNAYVIPHAMAKAYIKAIAKAEQKVKAETEETVANIKAEAEKRAIAYTKAIAKIKTETREKAKDEAEEAIAKLKEKSEAEAAETIAKVKAEAEELRAEAKRLKAEAEKLKAVAVENATKEEHLLPASAEAIPTTGARTPVAMYAKDIMQKDILWGSPEDSIQHALTKIQQHETDYMMIGHGRVLEGIVSKSDLIGAISPYLRPIFAKWRRPLDDASLQIKIKWVMSGTVHTVAPEMSLAAVIENMYRFGVQCFPVVDLQGEVQGLVTAFDVFRVLLKNN